MMRQFIIVIATISVGGFALAQNIPALFDRPGRLVPNQRTAIVIADAVLFPIYGEKTIRGERPYVVKLGDGKWTIEGTLPRGFVGGTFHIVIRQRDARVIEISHGA
jgi:hypothetical protein